MPELPEVESLRRSLEPYVNNQTIVSVRVLLPKLVSDKGTVRKASLVKVKEFVTHLRGKKIVNITRRAKNLIILLETEEVVVIHLKMTGQLVFVPYDTILQSVSGGHPIEISKTTLPNKHSYIIFELTNGVLYYNDIRQFGYVLYYPSLDAAVDDGHFGGLGLEPDDVAFTSDYFFSSLQKRKSIVKKILLDQEIVVGCGNIYADETLFAAGLLPTRAGNSITRSESDQLHLHIQRILALAISQGGSSIANYLLADGSRGNYARFHQVYMRSGKPCLVCDTALSKSVISARTTVFCEVCQV